MKFGGGELAAMQLGNNTLEKTIKEPTFQRKGVQMREFDDFIKRNKMGNEAAETRTNIEHTLESNVLFSTIQPASDTCTEKMENIGVASDQDANTILKLANITFAPFVTETNNK